MSPPVISVSYNPGMRWTDRLSICLSVRLSVGCQSVCPSVRLSLSVRPSVCLSVGYPSVSLSVRLSFLFFYLLP